MALRRTLWNEVRMFLHAVYNKFEKMIYYDDDFGLMAMLDIDFTPREKFSGFHA